MARLKSGQIAAGVAAKSSRLSASVENLVAAVSKAAAHPEKYAEIRCHLATYRDLANWEDKALGICAMAQNTLRKNIETVCEGGLAGFERLRERALGRARENNKPKSSGTDYRVLVNHLVEFNAQYLDLLERVTNLGGTNPKIASTVRSHLKLFPNARNGLVLSTEKGR